MARFKFNYQPIFKVNKSQPDAQNQWSFFKFLSIFRIPEFEFDFDRRLENMLSSFEEKRAKAETESKNFDERAKDIVRRKGELDEGIDKLPTDMPTEFMNAVNAGISSLRESLTNEAKEIASASDSMRREVDNALYEMKRETERLTRTANRFHLLMSLPFIGVFGGRRYTILKDKTSKLHLITLDTSSHYERLLYSRKIVDGL